MAAAVARLSPVIITTSMPRACSAATAAAEPSLMVSATPITPAGRPSTATSMGVLPSAASRSRSAASGAGIDARARSSRRRLPTSTCADRRRGPARPAPVIESNSAASGSGQAAVPGAGHDRGRQRVLGGALDGGDQARGAPPRRTRRPAARRSGSGLPLVIVPVLSRTTVSSLCAVSSASAERIRMPAVAPLPVPTVIDSGVARPSAHGQAMISTDTAATRAKTTAGGGPTRSPTPRRSRSRSR